MDVEKEVQVRPCLHCDTENKLWSLHCEYCGESLPKKTRSKVISYHPDYVEFRRRLFAFMIDYFLCVIGSILIEVLVRSITGDASIADVFSALVIPIYFIGFWTLAKGQTPGKMWAKIRIVTSEGNPIGFGRSIMRYLGYMLSSLMLFIGFLMILWDDDYQGFHDKMARTYVIESYARAWEKA